MTTPTTSVAGTLPAASNPQATSTTTGSSALASAAGSTAATTTTAGIHLGTIAATGGAVVMSAATTMSLQGGFTFPRVPNAAGVASSLPLSTPGVVAPVSMVYGSSVPSVAGVSYGYYGGYGHPVPSSGVPLYPGTRGSGGIVPGIKDISSKPPVMKGSFDLYAVQLRTFLTRLGLWGVVDGTDVRPLSDVDAQVAFDSRDNAARDAILRGVPEVDAEMICHEASAKDMWISFENKQTKREYANYIFAREQLYSNKYTRDQILSDWLCDMELQRRELQHYGKGISDEEFAEILLGNVSRTHREVVRQFSRHYAVLAVLGTHQLAPTAAQVMNALRAEEDLDEKVAEEMPQASISLAKTKSSNSSGIPNSDNSGKGNAGKGKRQRGRGRYKTKDKTQEGKSAGGSGGKRSDGCWNCGELDHIRAHCPSSKKNNDSQGQKPCAGMEAKWFQNKKGGNSEGVTRSVDALTQRSIGATVVGCKPRKSNNMEWVLDTATDVHVCKAATLLVNSRPDKEHIFLDFDGQPKGERVVGEVRLLATNVTYKQDEELVLHGVVHTPTGPDNLLWSHQLEESGWSMSFTQMNMKRICWLEKDGLKLSMVKTRGRYRLHARPANERSSVISLTAAATKKAAVKKKNAAARWHMRFAHLNYPALCQMAAQETVVVLEELCGNAGCPSSELDDNCWMCTASMLKRMSYKLTQTRRATEPFQKLMSDMCSIGDVTYDGYRCFQLVMDEATRWVWGFLMKAKEESRPVVVAHLEWLLAQGKHIEVFGTDQGKELVKRKLKAFLRGRGIEFLWTNAYSPEENGLVEKMNGVLEARIRSLLTTANMPWMLWVEAIMFAVDVSNVSPSRGLGGDTPYTRRFGERPSVDQLKIWGCIVHVFTPKVLRKSKLENPGKLGLFVGFAKHSESVRVLNLKTGKIEEKRSVVFDEG
ncbi:hypothetical protein PF003_g13163 [Phytophthora fragariae]|nr:hypothetical protein PF003_g13163 [Phytophthora fragariae]